MGNQIRVALPGYNAETDTDPNHFAIDSDQTTNILLKEYQRGSVTLAAGATQTITHNFGYIPFFMVFANGSFVVNGNTKSGYFLCSSGGAVSVPGYEGYADTTTLVITNNTGSSVTFWYYLFYDNVSGTSSLKVNFSKRSVRVALTGKNALTATDPNDFKYHSDFNTFKVVSKTITTVSVLTGSNIYAIAHSAKSANPLFVVFAQFPDGKVTQISFPSNLSYNNAENGGDGHSIDTTWWDSTNLNIYIASVGTGYSIKLVFYELEPTLI